MVRLFNINDSWVVSQYETWVEGSYDSPAAAEYAVTLHPDILHEICANHDYRAGNITLEELKQGLNT